MTLSFGVAKLCYITITIWLSVFNGLVTEASGDNVMRHGAVMPGGHIKVNGGGFNSDSEMAMFMSMFGGGQKIDPAEVNAALPDCELLNAKQDLDAITAMTSSDEDTITLVWFYTANNQSSLAVAKHVNKLCREFKEKKIEKQSNKVIVKAVAFDLTDTNRATNRQTKLEVLSGYGLQNHIHDLELVLIWGHLGPQQSVQFTRSGDHDMHHLEGEVQIKSAVKMARRWIDLMVQPVRVLSSLKSVLEFLDQDHSNNGPTILINKGTDQLVREKFYHNSPDIMFGEVDFANFDSSLDVTGQHIATKLHLPNDWWKKVIKEHPDPNKFVIIKNHYDALEEAGKPHEHAFARPKGLGTNYVKHPLIFWQTKALRNLLPMAERAMYGRHMNDPSLKYDLLTRLGDAIGRPLFYNTSDAEHAFENKKPIYFVAVENAQQLIPYWSQIQETATELRGDVIFMIGNADTTVVGSGVTTRLLHHLNIESSELPTIKLVTFHDRGAGMWEKEKLYCPDEGYLSSKKLMMDYFNKFTKGELKICVRSEYLEDNMHYKGEPEVLVGFNFHDEVYVKDIHKDILIDAYAPWCGHCKAFEPQLRKLAELAAFVPDETVRIVKIDATRNDLPGIGQLRGYPSILFFPGGQRTRPIEHRGSRSAEDLIKWIAEKATNKFDVADVVQKRLDSKGSSADILSRKAQIRAVLDEL